MDYIHVFVVFEINSFKIKVKNLLLQVESQFVLDSEEELVEETDGQRAPVCHHSTRC